MDRTRLQKVARRYLELEAEAERCDDEIATTRRNVDMERQGDASRVRILESKIGRLKVVREMKYAMTREIISIMETLGLGQQFSLALQEMRKEQDQ